MRGLGTEYTSLFAWSRPRPWREYKVRPVSRILRLFGNDLYLGVDTAFPPYCLSPSASRPFHSHSVSRALALIRTQIECSLSYTRAMFVTDQLPKEAFLPFKTWMKYHESESVDEPLPSHATYWFHSCRPRGGFRTEIYAREYGQGNSSLKSNTEGLE